MALELAGNRPRAQTSMSSSVWEKDNEQPWCWENKTLESHRTWSWTVWTMTQSPTSHITTSRPFSPPPPAQLSFLYFPPLYSGFDDPCKIDMKIKWNNVMEYFTYLQLLKKLAFLTTLDHMRDPRKSVTITSSALALFFQSVWNHTWSSPQAELFQMRRYYPYLKNNGGAFRWGDTAVGG